MIPFAQQVAVVTGASSGVGRAIAQALSARGATVCGVARRLNVLESTIPPIRPYVADLGDDGELHALCRLLCDQCDRIDVLVHGAGIISIGPAAVAPIEDFDRQFRINARAPYVLTQALLPHLKRSRGHVVYINSSVVGQAKAGVSQYAASNAALKSLADSLRAEVNGDGIRVTSLFLGQTATPMQEDLHRLAGREYQPSLLLQPEDVAESVVGVLSLPRTAEVTDVHIRPMLKPA